MNATDTGPYQSARALAHEPDFTVGAITFRPSLCEAEIGGEVRHLEPRVALVLVALGHSEGCVMSRDDLIARCWDGVVVGDDAINRVIGKIRRLADSPEAGFLIETVPRVGYRLVRANGSHAPDLGAVHREPPLPTDAPSEPLVAVLPFDGDGCAETASLAEGATDCILSRLTGESGLSVVSRPDSFQFRGTRKSDAARELGATQLVDGAVSLCGDEVRITAYLINAALGLMVWSEQFRGTIADPFTLQHLSAVRVAEALRRNMAGSDFAPLRQVGSRPLRRNDPTILPPGYPLSW
jgi:TolB-like protein